MHVAVNERSFACKLNCNNRYFDMKGTTHKERENSPIDCVSICSFNDLPQQNNNAAPQPKIPVFENNVIHFRSKQLTGPFLLKC